MLSEWAAAVIGATARLVVEDVVTSGGQLVESVRQMKGRGAEIGAAICVIDREEGGREALEAIGVELSSLFTRTELSRLTEPRGA